MEFWVLIVMASSCFYLPGTYGYMGATMGVAQQSCDDGKTNLIVDWDYSFTAYSCMGTTKWKSNPDIAPLYYTIPNFNARKDQVWHYCMNTSILYKDRPPIRGHHRPLWAKYGEYLYVPPQRWLHNLEHGSVVMLYHPCADEEQVNKLRQLVTSCLWRHVITPYDKLSTDRPFALVAWGAKLEMNTVDVIQSILFMRKHAHVAPEDLSKEGQYDEMLLKPAAMVSDKEDSVVCPWVPTTNINADGAQTGQLSRNMLFGTAPNGHHHLANAIEYRQSRPLDPAPIIGQGKWVPISPQTLPVNGRWQRKRRAIPDLSRDRRTFVDVMNLAEKYNGPKFVPDVLPPHAILQMYEQPSYVVAGSFLGKDPLHPNTIQNSMGGPTVPQPNGQPGNSPIPAMPPQAPPPQAPQQGMGSPNNNVYRGGLGDSGGGYGMQQNNGGQLASGTSPADILAAMAMLMRKDSPTMDVNNFQAQTRNGPIFPDANANFRFPPQQPQQQQFPIQMPQNQPQPANFFFSASDPRQMQQEQQQQSWQNRNGNEIWARTANNGNFMGLPWNGIDQRGQGQNAVAQELLALMMSKAGNQRSTPTGRPLAHAGLDGLSYDQIQMFSAALGGGGGLRHGLKVSKLLTRRR